MTRREQKERNISDVEMGLSGRNFPCEEDALAADCYQLFICLLRPLAQLPSAKWMLLGCSFPRPRSCSVVFHVPILLYAGPLWFLCAFITAALQ